LYYKYPYNRSVVLFAGQDLYGKANLANLRAVLAILFLVVTAVVALAGWLFSQRALAPITRVMNELEGILPQNLGVRLKTSNNRDEIGRLTDTFNKLLDRIENRSEERRVGKEGKAGRASEQDGGKLKR